MKQWIKRGTWPDWVVLCIHISWWLTLVINLFTYEHQGLPIPLWAALALSLIPLCVPLLLRFFHWRWFLVAEMVLPGGFIVFLNPFGGSNVWQLITICFIIGFLSGNGTYRWTAAISIAVIPAVIGLASGIDWVKIVFYVMLHYAIVYALGYAFQLAVLTHKQGHIIQEQNRILEQHVSQVEQMTLTEERNRLSKELHDTVGHTLTSIIMGIESLRPTATDDQADRLDALLRTARHGLEEVRSHLHQMSTSNLHASFTVSLQKLVSKFQETTGVEVKFRTFGDEYAMPHPVKLTLYRCLQEALTNAVRHGQASIIHVQLQFEAGQCRLQVQDNGAGNEQLQPGFGLSTMKERLVELSGHLSVHSHPEEGTVILCTVPRGNSLQSKIRLGIADDQPLILDSLRMILDDQQGLQVVGTAGNGQAAVELCEQELPDVILMDARMPEMDGIEALQVIKERWPDLRVIVMSTFSEMEQAVLALQHGAAGYLLKSIQPSELIDTIRLVHAGGTAITQEIAEQVFEAMKRQQLQLSERQAGATLNSYGLTQRELDLLDRLLHGSKYKTIAVGMNLSEGTVRNYISVLYSKLGVNNRHDAVTKAKEEGLIGEA